MKHIAFLFPLIFIALFTYGQANVEIGIKSGVKLANGSAGSAETNSFLAFQAGGYSLIKFSKFGIQPEVLWSRQGAEIENGQDFDLNYINVPIMFKYFLPSGFNVQAGPQFGVLIGSEDEEGNSLDLNLNSGDAGAVIGFGWDAPSGLQLSARYIHGLTDIVDEPGSEFRHRIFQLSIGYSFFKLGK